MTSQVTLSILRQYLEQFGWSNYKATDEPQEQEGIIYTGWRSSPDEPGYNLVIDPMVEKGIVQFKVPEIVKVPIEGTDPAIVHEVLLAIGHANYATYMGKFGYDMRDGEVRYSHVLPIEENDITYSQFEHCMRVAISMTMDYAPKLRDIAEGKMTAAQALAEELRPPESVIQSLRDLLAMLEGRVTGGDDSTPPSGDGSKPGGGDDLTQV
jgi:hypothetical protein